MLPLSEAGPSGEQAAADDGLGVAPRGGTLIVAPLSVLDAVWARELASKAVMIILIIIVHNNNNTDNNNNNSNNSNNNSNNNNNNSDNSSNDDSEIAFQLMMSKVRVGQVFSLQSSLSCASSQGNEVNQSSNQLVIALIN